MTCSRAARPDVLWASGLLAVVLLSAFVPLRGGEDDGIRYRPHPDSQFWIEGDAEVRRFECRVGRVHGSAVLRDTAGTLPTRPSDPEAPGDVKARRTTAAVSASTPSSPATEQAPLDVEVIVPVRQFECGKEPMNADLYEALKADAHPAIRYRLQRLQLLPPADTAARSSAGSSAQSSIWRRVQTTGQLTVAGSTRTVRVMARGRHLDDGRARVRGQTPLRMTNFGVEPPSALFGMIEVQDRITVHFDLIGVPQE